MAQKRRFSAFVAKGHDPHSTILDAFQFAQDFLGGSCLEERSCVKAAILVEELVSNCLRHGGAKRDLSLSLSLHEIHDTVVLNIKDDGPAFDPSGETNFVGPDPESGGKIGLAIVRAWGDEIAYSRNNGCNVLHLTIK